jgi:hypothetical protein
MKLLDWQWALASELAMHLQKAEGTCKYCLLAATE